MGVVLARSSHDEGPVHRQEDAHPEGSGGYALRILKRLGTALMCLALYYTLISCSYEAGSFPLCWQRVLTRASHVQRSIDKWGTDEIKRWTSNTGLAAYNDVLASKGGQVSPCASCSFCRTACLLCICRSSSPSPHAWHQAIHCMHVPFKEAWLN